MREAALAELVRRAIAAVQRDGFRIVHFSIQSNHLHLIVEAADAAALARGMQWLNARIARTVNRTLRARGSLWRERYHARELHTPRSVRNALVYVLMNAKKHGHRFASGIDAMSSAPWFDGFAERAARDSDAPVPPPRTWLASIGVRSDERPRSPE